jgi:hypothetical protein
VLRGWGFLGKSGYTGGIIIKFNSGIYNIWLGKIIMELGIFTNNHN